MTALAESTRRDTGAAVEALGVRRAFAGRVVLDRVDLTMRAGEFVALLGRSGGGKSTFLRALAGLDPDVEGTVRVPRNRAVVFQNARLLPWKRVLANVTYGLRGAEPRERGRAALGEVGLADHERAWPVTLSGGEAQRAALARALVREPKLLLLDEPFGALDALTRLRMAALLQSLCERHHPAVLFVTHDVDEALQLADRVLVLRDGRLTLDRPVGVARPRTSRGEELRGLRTDLLRELGVEVAA